MGKMFLFNRIIQNEIAELESKLEDRRFSNDRQRQEVMREKKEKEEQVRPGIWLGFRYS